MSKREQYTSFFVILLIGIGVGVLFSRYTQLVVEPFTEIRQNQSQYAFTNPLLDCDLGESSLSESLFSPSKSMIQKTIKDEQNKSHISFASVYYRDLNNGPWIGINEHEKFFPASLMKVPLMMHYYQKARFVPGLFNQKVDISKIVLPVYTVDQHFKPEVTLDKTKTYTVGQLIEQMIRYSDNTAAGYLIYLMGNENGISNLLKDLYLEVPQDGQTDYLSVKQYGTFFRVLFNGSYLSRQDSEAALALLSKTTFDRGIAKYLPREVVVAHKFGEKITELPETKQVHDCGIVYLPKHPYLLCVMTRGYDLDLMSDSVALISKAVYEDIQKKIAARDQ
jgi:beta-lactamase class A